MQAGLPLIGLVTGAALPSPLRAVHEALVDRKLVAGTTGPRAGNGKLTAVLRERVREDVRLVGALAELFATAAAEQLMNAGLTLGSDEPIYRRPSNHSRRKVTPEFLPLIALAAGAALCRTVLAPTAVTQRDRARRERRRGQNETARPRSEARRVRHAKDPVVLVDAGDRDAVRRGVRRVERMDLAVPDGRR